MTGCVVGFFIAPDHLRFPILYDVAQIPEMMKTAGECIGCYYILVRSVLPAVVVLGHGMQWPYVVVFVATSGP